MSYDISRSLAQGSRVRALYQTFSHSTTPGVITLNEAGSTATVGTGKRWRVVGGGTVYFSLVAHDALLLSVQFQLHYFNVGGASVRFTWLNHQFATANASRLTQVVPVDWFGNGQPDDDVRMQITLNGTLGGAQFRGGVLLNVEEI